MSHKIKKTKKRLSLSNLLHHPTLTHSRFSKANLTIFILIFAGIGGYILLSSHAASSVANVFVSPNGSDTGSNCKRFASPVANPDTGGTSLCKSPSQAWSLSQAGDTIGVGDGDYMGGCALSGLKTSDVTFSGTSSARFICANDTNQNPLFAHHLHLNGVQHLVIDGITVGRISSEQTAGTIDHNTIKNLAITCQDASPWPLEAPGQKCSAQIQLVGNDWLFDNVTIGPGYDSGSCGGTGDANKFPVSNSLFKHVTFHDQRYQRYVALPHTAANFCNTGVDAQHTENIYMTGSNGLMFDGLVITNGTNSGYVDEQGLPSGTGPDTGALFLTSNGGSTPSNLTIRNCSVRGAGSTFSGGSTAPLLNTLVENCTLPSGAIFQCDSTHCPGGYQSLTLRNNIFGTNSGICPIASALGSSGGNMNDHNLFVYTGSGGSASQCGNTNLVVQTGFSTVLNDPSGSTLNWDLHLKSGSPAIDNADINQFAASDFDGVSRPKGSAADIGAYEYVPTSNVWVSTTGNDLTCVRGDQTKPCSTFLKAYQIAQCGDIVSISGGSYTAQIIGHFNSSQNNDAKNCSAANNPVIFTGQSQSGVSVGGISIGEPWLTINKVTMTSLYIAGYDSTIGCFTNPVAHVTVQDSVIDGQGARANPMAIDNVEYVNLLNNSIGNIMDGETEIHNGGNCAVNNNNITLSGNTWHDFINTMNGNVHMECLQIDAGTGGTGNSFFKVIGNKFLNCGQYDIFTSGPQHDMTYQNNWFDTPCSNQGSGCSVLASTSMGPNPDGSGDFYNIVVSFNSYAVDAQWPTISLSGTTTGNIIAYNIFPNSALDGLSSRCGSFMNATRINNYVNGNVTCSGDVKTAVTYASPGPPNYDYDLAAGSAAIDALSPCPSGAPSVDIDGDTRPQGSACDVGADEYVLGTTTVAKPGDINSDSHVNILDLSILLSHYGQVATSSQGDLTGDGRVSILDLSILLSHYGS